MSNKLEAFHEQLRRHDWWYMLSSDPETYRRGSSSFLSVTRTAASSPAHQKMFEDYREFTRNGGKEPDWRDYDVS